MTIKRFCDACDEELSDKVNSIVLSYLFPNKRHVRVDIKFSTNAHGSQQIIGDGDLCADCRKEALENGSPL